MRHQDSTKIRRQLHIGKILSFGYCTLGSGTILNEKWDPDPQNDDWIHNTRDMYGIISNFGIKLLIFSFQPVLRIHVRFL
jgi:hypothetical protein